MTPALRSFAAQWQTRSADSLSPVREQAMQQFLKLGLPTTRDETWRYTNLRSLAAQSFVDAPRKIRGEIEPNASLSLLDKTDRAASLLMVNGYPTMPVVDGLISGIEIYSLQEVARVDPDTLLRFLEPLSDADQQRWNLLNTALFVDGLYLKIVSHVAVPLVILHVAAADGANTIAYPRIIIEATPGSSATIIEHHVAQGDHTPLSNSNTHIALRQDAQLEHYRVFATGADATHLDSLSIRQDRDSRCKQYTIVLGGGMVRTALEAHLDQPGAALDSYSLLVGHEERHVDCVNIVTHGAPNTRSNQTARAIASDASRVIFNTKVIVEAGSVHAQSQQSCRGLLLSPSAEIDTRPQLEIHADEVKCAHGATTGRLDPDMLFYMLSRGLDRDTAQSLLVYAFLADVLTGMSVASARAAIENALIAQLPDSQTLRKFR
jgi:Fe-S cluster assembly protein SufD